METAKKHASRSATKAKFTHEQEVRLAWEVERRPILWDATQEIYRRPDLKPPVWAEVA